MHIHTVQKKISFLCFEFVFEGYVCCYKSIPKHTHELQVCSVDLFTFYNFVHVLAFQVQADNLDYAKQYLV